jgi:hypothetical protein
VLSLSLQMGGGEPGQLEHIGRQGDLQDGLLVPIDLSLMNTMITLEGLLSSKNGHQKS